MEMVGYTQESNPETSARAIGRELPISPRHSVIICRHIRGWPLEKAKDFLSDVTKLKAAVPDRRYGGSAERHAGKRTEFRRAGLRCAEGRYPEQRRHQGG